MRSVWKWRITYEHSNVPLAITSHHAHNTGPPCDRSDSFPLDPHSCRVACLKCSNCSLTNFQSQGRIEMRKFGSTSRPLKERDKSGKGDPETSSDGVGQAGLSATADVDTEFKYTGVIHWDTWKPDHRFSQLHYRSEALVTGDAANINRLLQINQNPSQVPSVLTRYSQLRVQRDDNIRPFQTTFIELEVLALLLESSPYRSRHSTLLREALWAMEPDIRGLKRLMLARTMAEVPELHWKLIRLSCRSSNVPESVRDSRNALSHAVTLSRRPFDEGPERRSRLQNGLNASIKAVNQTADLLKNIELRRDLSKSPTLWILINYSWPIYKLIELLWDIGHTLQHISNRLKPLRRRGDRWSWQVHSLVQTIRLGPLRQVKPDLTRLAAELECLVSYRLYQMSAEELNEATQIAKAQHS